MLLAYFRPERLSTMSHAPHASEYSWVKPLSVLTNVKTVHNIKTKNWLFLEVHRVLREVGVPLNPVWVPVLLNMDTHDGDTSEIDRLEKPPERLADIGRSLLCDVALTW